MCGIFYCSRKDETVTQRAAELLKSRGPDEQHIMYPNDLSSVVFQRLAINDTVSEEAKQPMIKNNVLMMCNGEIFNHQSLELQYDITCSSKSDCEVLLHLYLLSLNSAFSLSFPDKVLNAINGDFALLIYDMCRNCLVLARDRVGVRPLFFGRTLDGSGFMVASEVKCLFNCDPSTIRHVRPGTMVVIDLRTRTITESVYASFIEDSVTISTPLEIKLKTLLHNAVKIRLMSDRPIGCLLSGGLDSSVITCILCNILGAKNVRTYSIGMAGSLDLKYAKMAADYLGTTHTEVIFTPAEGLQAIPKVIHALESYDITTVRASVGMYLLGKYISTHTDDKVIFSGEGSDEIMCGYLYFHDAPGDQEAHDESLRLISELYMYDCLRADRCISSNGLELRVPFLDKNVLSFCMNLSGDLKRPKNKMEKRLLREAFSNTLPSEVVWRRKDGFSDGVSGKDKSWYEYIQEFCDTIVDSETASDCVSKEAWYYKTIYDAKYPFFPKPIPAYWMPRWSKTCDASNPSGRIVPAFKEDD